MIDDPTPTSASEPELLPPPADAASRGARRSSADVAARRPAYKGAELDAARGPGLGCFWFQAAVLAIFLVLIPVGVNLNGKVLVQLGAHQGRQHGIHDIAAQIGPRNQQQQDDRRRGHQPV